MEDNDFSELSRGSLWGLERGLSEDSLQFLWEFIQTQAPLISAEGLLVALTAPVLREPCGVLSAGQRGKKGRLGLRGRKGSFLILKTCSLTGNPR